MQTLSEPIDRLALTALGKGWADHGRLIAHWREIVGEEWARHSTPVRIAFPPGKRTGGTLQIALPQALALELQHETPTILGKINAFFGYAAIARLSYSSRKAAPMAAEPVMRSLGAKQKNAITLSTSVISESPLREALIAFGESLLAKPE